MVKIFLADIGALDISARLAEVCDYRQEKVLRLNDERKKRRSLGAELLLNIAIPDHPEYLIGEHGKPFFDGGLPKFSLSHSGRFALCAVADIEIGADIEAPRKNSLKIAKRFFTESEFEKLKNASEPDEEFCRLWVIKESYIKATGKGLSASLSSFEAAEKIGEHRIRLLEHSGYRIAVCTLGEPGDVELIEVPL